MKNVLLSLLLFGQFFSGLNDFSVKAQLPSIALWKVIPDGPDLRVKTKFLQRFSHYISTPRLLVHQPANLTELLFW
jgi:hypothetical protein